MKTAIQERGARGGQGADVGARSGSPLVVVGGGITGLTAAAFAKQAGQEVRLYDRAERPGGVIGTVRAEGFLFERGPTTVLDRTEALGEAIALAGLQARMQSVALRGQARYIWHGGRLRRVPSGPMSFAATGLFSLGAKLRLAREPWTARVAEDETLKEFIVRRLGREIFERAFEPMCAGIWAGDPKRMSTEHAFPVLKQLEREGGGLARGLFKRARAARKQGTRRRAVHMVSFPEGLEQLPRALVETLGDSYRGGAEVKSIKAEEPSQELTLRIERGGRTETIRTERVILAVEARAAAELLRGLEPELAARLEAVHYCPLAVVGLGVESRSLSLPEGFGFLVARGQGLRVLGCIFNSNIFAGRAPKGCAALTVMVGGDLDPVAAGLEDEKLMELVRHDLGRAIGWNGEARAVHIERWGGAIPQYDMRHGELLAAVEDSERRRPGLQLLGNWRGGVSIGERIERAKQAIERAMAGSNTPSDG